MEDAEICAALGKAKEDCIQALEVPRRPGSPEPPRGRSGETPWGNIILDTSEKTDGPSELFQEHEAELHGLGTTQSQGSGYYQHGRHAGRFPDATKVGIMQSDDGPSGAGGYKICATDTDNIAAAIEAILAPERYLEELTENPPMGSWHLFIDSFAVLDREDRTEIRIDLEPGDGLSIAGTSATLTPTSVYVKTELGDDPKKGPRAWSFALDSFPAPINPETSSVTIIPKQKQLFICLIKAQAEATFWNEGPGSIYAPVTKINYRSFQPHGPTPRPTLPSHFLLSS